MKPAKIELHIEELALHGFAPGDRYRIAESVERELTRLLAEPGEPLALALGNARARVDAGTFNLAPDAGPDSIGVQVARAVYGGLSQ